MGELNILEIAIVESEKLGTRNPTKQQPFNS